MEIGQFDRTLGAHQTSVYLVVSCKKAADDFPPCETGIAGCFVHGAVIAGTVKVVADETAAVIVVAVEIAALMIVAVIVVAVEFPAAVMVVDVEFPADVMVVAVEFPAAVMIVAVEVVAFAVAVVLAAQTIGCAHFAHFVAVADFAVLSPRNSCSQVDSFRNFGFSVP